MIGNELETRNWHDIPIQPLQSDEHNQVSIAEPAMPTLRRTIRLFVSSTFSGMKAERDVSHAAPSSVKRTASVSRPLTSAGVCATRWHSTGVHVLFSNPITCSASAAFPAATNGVRFGCLASLRKAVKISSRLSCDVMGFPCRSRIVRPVFRPM